MPYFGVPGDTFCTANLCKSREAVAVHHSRSVPLPPETPGLVGRVGIPDWGQHRDCLAPVSANFVS